MTSTARMLHLLIPAACVALAGPAALAAPGDTTLVSVRDQGVVTALGPSFDAKVSADGRYVAFRSAARDLVPGKAEPRVHGYIRDLVAGTIERISVGSDAAVANADTDNLAISANGRFVAFGSKASNLVHNDTNGVGDVFVRDRLTGLTERVSVDSSGRQATRASFAPCISTNGRYVAFGSRAPNLVPGDTNGVDDLFVRDRQAAQTWRISVSSGGAQADGHSYACSFSNDGRYVAFISRAGNLVSGDTNGADDAFVHDLVARTTERVSISTQGAQANQGVLQARGVALSADGRFVAFASGSTNLVPGDTNGRLDVFVRDRVNRRTERVSVTSTGLQANGESYLPVMSADGRYVGPMRPTSARQGPRQGSTCGIASSPGPSAQA